MVVLTFQIRMKTADYLKRLIEGFSSDVSAAGQYTNYRFQIRNGLVVHIYTILKQQSIVKTAKMVAFICAGVCQWDY